MLDIRTRTTGTHTDGQPKKWMGTYLTPVTRAGLTVPDRNHRIYHHTSPALQSIKKNALTPQTWLWMAIAIQYGNHIVNNSSLPTMERRMDWCLIVHTPCNRRIVNLNNIATVKFASPANSHAVLLTNLVPASALIFLVYVPYARSNRITYT
jgi:hypothetical protein